MYPPLLGIHPFNPEAALPDPRALPPLALLIPGFDGGAEPSLCPLLLNTALWLAGPFSASEAALVTAERRVLTSTPRIV